MSFRSAPTKKLFARASACTRLIGARSVAHPTAPPATKPMAATNNARVHIRLIGESSLNSQPVSQNRRTHVGRSSTRKEPKRVQQEICQTQNVVISKRYC